MKTLTKEEQSKREELYRFAWDKLGQYDLREKGWTVTILPSKLRNMKNSTIGHCDYRRKEIVVSLEWLLNNDLEEMKQTVLHEIAHALLMNKPHRHNSQIFKEKCMEVGLQPHKKVTRPFARRQVKEYTGTCPVCGKVYIKSRRYNGSCGVCTSEYDERYKLIWR